MLLQRLKRHNIQHFMLKKHDNSKPEKYKTLAALVATPLMLYMLTGVMVFLGAEAGTETGLLIKNAIRVVDPTFISLSATPAKLKPLKALGSAKLPKIQDSK